MENCAKKIILASNSPRRREILSSLGLEFEIMKSDFKEIKNELFKYEYIEKNSQGKALDIASRLNFDALVISADTVVILDSVCLNKPRNVNEAIFMLKNLSGKTHKVISSVCIVETPSMKIKQDFCETFVTFRNLSEEEILKYIKEKNPLDKAGSYGIQDFISINETKNPPKESFISKIEGDYLNVVGMSADLVLKLLSKF